MKDEQLAALQAENQRLQKINAALIERVESGGAATTPYAAFEQAAALAEQVKARTAELTRLNAQLRQEIAERRVMEGRLRDAKRDAEQANRSKTRFLAAVSHDLLQPLNAARLFMAALEEMLQKEATQKLVSAASRSLADVESLLGTLVDISKLDAGVIQPEIGVFPLDELLDNLAAEYRQVTANEQLDFKHVRCRVQVRSDLHLLARILRNFLSNAVRYTHPGGRILLGCRRVGRAVRIQVIDTGLGIPADKLSSIFQEFQRLDTQVAGHKDQGLGLGLAIVDRMARILDHPVTVQSVLAQGSVFSVEVPLAEGEEPRGLQPLLPVVPQPLLQKRIWVLDNDRQICAAMQHLLGGWGCQVETATGATGLARLTAASGQPDLLVVDYHLDQGVSGLALVQDWMRQQQVRLPVVVITANHSHELKAEVKGLGYLLLYKPVKPLKLRQALVQLLKG